MRALLGMWIWWVHLPNPRFSRRQDRARRIRTILGNCGFKTCHCNMKFETANESIEHYGETHTLSFRFCKLVFALQQTVNNHERIQHIQRKCYDCRVGTQYWHCQRKFNTEKEKIGLERSSGSNVSSTNNCRKHSNKKPDTTEIWWLDCNKHWLQ